jgi:hypothetical protein
VSKLDEIVSWMRTEAAEGIGNRAITVLFECDEALVRKARHRAEIASLRSENADLRQKLIELSVSSAAARPSDRKARLPRRPVVEFYPLFALMEEES